MNEEEKFDDLLRSKTSERDFPFDDMNWDEAERLIIKQEKRRKTFRFIIIFSAGLIAGIIIMLPFILNTHNATGGVAGSLSSNQKPVTPNQSLSSVNQSKNGANVNITNKENVSSSTQPVSEGNITKQGIVKLPHAAEIPPRQSSLLAKKEKTKTPNNTRSSPDIEIAAVKTNKVSELSRTNNYIQPTVGEKPPDKNSEPMAITNITANPSDTINKQHKNYTTENKVTSENTGIKNNEPGKKVSSKATGVNDSASLMKTKNSNTGSLITPRDSVRNPNTENYAANILSIYAGTGYSFGWNHNGAAEANGITPWAGFAYAHYFNSGIGVSAGIGYAELNKLNETYTGSMIQYDFGANTQMTTVTPQAVYYLAIPLNIQFNPDNKDVLSAGINYLFMLTTSSTLSHYQQTNFSNSLISSEKQNGYTQGFSNSDIQLSVSYTRMLTKRFGISFGGYWGFVSIENSSFTGITQYGKNKGGRLVLLYQLIK